MKRLSHWDRGLNCSSEHSLNRAHKIHLVNYKTHAYVHLLVVGRAPAGGIKIKYIVGACCGGVVSVFAIALAAHVGVGVGIDADAFIVI